MIIELPVFEPELIARGTAAGEKFEIYKIGESQMLIHYAEKTFVISMAGMVGSLIKKMEDTK